MSDHKRFGPADPEDLVQSNIGILTSGGDCPGLNAVIRGAVRSAERLGYGCIGFLHGYEGLVDPIQYRKLTSENVSGILMTGGTILGSTNQGRFCAVKGENTRVDLDPNLLQAVKQSVAQLNLAGLICVGGDGSLAVAQQFFEVGIPVVGVPKTIDNDLSATAFTFGFDSAVACATEAIDRLHTTGASHGRVMILEVMGRHAGWIALHAGVAGGADVILLPEIRWTWDNIAQQIETRRAAGKNFTIIVVAEGTHLPDGEHVVRERRQEDRQTRLGGIGNVVAYELSARLGVETRSTVLGHLQRGGMPTAFDRLLATQFGVHATRLVHQGLLGRMVCYQPHEILDVSIQDAVGQLNRVTLNNATVVTARGLGISFGDLHPTDPFDAIIQSSAQTTADTPTSFPGVIPFIPDLDMPFDSTFIAE
ncbi:MAG: ATP-dependent 6-phosphofructokinase [Planctomycetales bacterium]|nr:ATP-dependent 6-phosphofructokinase [Planctomycetales bacterium]